MKTLLKIFTVIASVIIIAVIVLNMAGQRERKLESAYEYNCQDVKIGMPVSDAMKIMKRGLEIDYDGFQHGVKFSGTVPYDLFLAYSTNGGSFIAEIHYDKNTGMVTMVECPPKHCR